MLVDIVRGRAGFVVCEGRIGGSCWFVVEGNRDRDFVAHSLELILVVVEPGIHCPNAYQSRIDCFEEVGEVEVGFEEEQDSFEAL